MKSIMNDIILKNIFKLICWYPIISTFILSYIISFSLILFYKFDWNLLQYTGKPNDLIFGPILMFFAIFLIVIFIFLCLGKIDYYFDTDAIEWFMEMHDKYSKDETLRSIYNEWKLNGCIYYYIKYRRKRLTQLSYGK